MKSRYYLLLIIVFFSCSSGFSQAGDSTVTIAGDTLKTATAMDSIRNNIRYYMPQFRMRNFMDTLVVSAWEAEWKSFNKFGVNVSEVTFSNWNAGGSNSLAVLLEAEVRRTLEGENIRWKNELISRYGINAQKGQKLRKTDDHFEVNSTFGFRPDTLTNWYYSAKMTFKSQFDKGYNYPEREHSISGLLAPGYLFAGIGAELGKDSEKFSLYLSPATEKATFVIDQRLADQGAFGVKPAQYDNEGNLIKNGKKSKTEFGFLLTNDFRREIFENIQLTNRLTLYTDYIKDFGNIDVDWKLDLELKVNKYVLAKVGSHLIYDNDTKLITQDEENNDISHGAKVQWKQQLSIGFVFEI